VIESISYNDCIKCRILGCVLQTEIRHMMSVKSRFVCGRRSIVDVDPILTVALQFLTVDLQCFLSEIFIYVTLRQ
jgi:hypothetical protein